MLEVVDSSGKVGEMRLSGKVALVTGAGNGIGQAIAERFAAEGASVVALDLEAESVASAVERINANGGHAEAVAGDIAKRDDVARAASRCVERFGGLDILAANAGIADAQPLLEIDERSWRRIIDVNLTGTFFCIQEAARVMIPARKGAIVVTASTNAFYVETNMAHYNASKGGVVALVRSAALDLGPYGIRVNAIEPSMVKTRAAFITEDPVGGPEYLKRVPLGRFAETSEIASTVAFLASDDASYITGETIILDGGLTLGVHLPLPEEPLPGSARATEG
jgi:3-oxoacyl-[acyl-carrier protein] reductase